MRSAIARLVGLTSLGLALLLAIVSGLCFWASSYIGDQVHQQLSMQKITMPSGKAIEDPAIKPYLEKYQGQELLTGPQAEAFANHYIAVHLDKMGQGKTYEEVSGEFMKLSKDPSADKTKVAELGQLRQTMFMGQTLRGMLLFGFAFATMGTIAGYAGWATAIGALASLVAGLVALSRARKADDATGAHASRA